MTDITNTNLEAAFLDQKVAGLFRDKSYAFIAVCGDDWSLGIAVEGERGYNPIDGKSFPTQAEAREWADGLNEHIGLTSDRVGDIITSTLRGS